VLEDAHFAEEVALLEGRQDAGLAADRLQELHRPRLDDVHVGADVALGEQDFAHEMADEELLVGVLAAAPRSRLEDGLHVRHAVSAAPAPTPKSMRPPSASTRARQPSAIVRGRGRCPAGKPATTGKGAPAK